MYSSIRSQGGFNQDWKETFNKVGCKVEYSPLICDYNDGKIIINLSEWVESILYPKNIVQPDYLSSAW